MNYNKCSDSELFSLIQEGDGDAFTVIYNRYWGTLFNHVRRMLSDDDLASDIVQDIFVVLWDQKDKLSIHTNISSYLYSAGRNRVITYINRSKLRDLHLNSLKEFIESGVNSTDELTNEKELIEIIEREVKKLPLKMRVVFEMSRKDYLSYNEIAHKLEVTEHTVRKQISNSLKILKSKLRTIINFIFF